MLGLAERIAGTSVSDLLITQADAEEMERLKRFKRAWQAYEHGSDLPLKTRPGEPDDNIIIPYEQVIVNKGRSFLFGENTSFTISAPGQDAGAQAAQTYLDALWKWNRKQTKLLKLATNGGVFGHVYVKIALRAGDPFPRLVVLDPMTVGVDPDPEDIDGEPVEYRITYNTVVGEGSSRRAVVRRQRITRSGGVWEIIDEEADLRSGQPLGWTEVGREAWPYAWPPILDCQNLPIPNEYWGRSDLEASILKLNYQINRLISNINRIIRLHAHPHLKGEGLTEEQLDGLDLTPDSIIPLPPDTDITAVQLQSDLKSALDTYLRLKEILHEVTRIPEIATGKMEHVGQLSGAALQILYGPIAEATNDKRQTYGDMLRELNKRLLELGGYDASYEVEINWPKIVPQDPQAEAAQLQADKELGASRDTLLEKRGYDPDIERQRRQADQDEQLEAELRRIEGGLTAGGE